MDTLLALGCGMGLGVLLTYLTSTRPLVRDIQRMHYSGFRVVQPPPKPKYIPVPDTVVRED